MEKAARKKRKRWILRILLIALLIVLALLGIWKRRGIRNTVYRMFGIPVPETTKTYGYYEKEITTDADLTRKVTFQLSDADADSIDTNAERQSSLIAKDYEIDRQITAELGSGAYTFQDPLVISDPYQMSPLTGFVLFITEEPCRVRVTVKGRTENADLSGETAYGTEHRVPLIGLYPNTENEVELCLLSENDEVLDQSTLSVKTDGLPEGIADLVEPVTLSGDSAYGMTIVSGQSVLYPVGFDCNGDIRWYLNRKTSRSGVFSLSDHRLIFQDADGYITSVTKTYATVLYEMDFLGRAYQMYFVPEGTHHEVIEKEPGGNLLVLSNTLEDHIEDKVVELDRETGEIVDSLAMEEIFGEEFVTRIDWAHVNTVSYNAQDDTILVSLRNLNAAVKIGWTTHEIVWILSNPEVFAGTEFESYVLTPEEDFMWHYQQHAVYEIAEDLDNDPDTIEISMFDNHSQTAGKVSYYEETEDSYLTVYAVRESTGTVSLLKQIPVERSRITSNTIYDAGSGHLFGMCGWIVGESDVTGMVYEFDYETEELLNQYEIKKKFYRAFEMEPDYEALSSPMEIGDTDITGTLRTPVRTEKTIREPDQILEEGISLRLTSCLLFVEAENQRVSQIIFHGEDASYVYDMSLVKLRSKTYLDVSISTPIPLVDLEPGSYDVYCVYENDYYDTGVYLKIG